MSSDDRLEIVERTPLFTLLPGDSYSGDAPTYTMSRDGERFLMIVSAGADLDVPSEFIAVENFLDELGETVGR